VSDVPSFFCLEISRPVGVIGGIPKFFGSVFAEPSVDRGSSRGGDVVEEKDTAGWLRFLDAGSRRGYGFLLLGRNFVAVDMGINERR